jgi:hypothetical protein
MIATRNSYVNTLGELKEEFLLRKYFSLTGATEINRGKWRLMFIFFIFFLLGFLEYVLVLPFIEKWYPLYIGLTAVFGGLIFFFLLAWCVHPGFIKVPRSREVVLADMKSVETHKICPDC